MKSPADLFITLCGLIHSGHAHTPDYVNWATGELVAGHDTPRLRVLAGLTNDTSYGEASFEFERTLEELGWTFPSKEEAISLYIRQLAQALLDGTRAPFDVCAELHEIFDRLDFDADFPIWFRLYWAYRDFQYGFAESACAVLCVNDAQVPGLPVRLRRVSLSGRRDPGQH